MHRYFILNKPYGMVSQFLSTHQVRLLGDLDFTFPEGTHAIGRLDNYSEGLLLLTTDKRMTRLLFESVTPHKRTYLVQVKHKVEAAGLEALREGVFFRIRGGGYYTSIPCEAMIEESPTYPFDNGYELHENLVTTWLRISLTEGKYHQVRKMVNAIGHRCIRLIRLSIEDLELGNLEPGAVRELGAEEAFRKLKIGGQPPPHSDIHCQI